MDVEELVQQIGPRVILSISGGRIERLSEDLVRLPVSNGYAVEVELDRGQDLYTVRRTFTRHYKGRKRIHLKGEVTGIYCDQLSDMAYYASCFRSYDEDTWMHQG